VAVDGQGWPVAFEVLPGNVADAEAPNATIARFRERFCIRRAVVVADRGMLAKATLAVLRDHETAPFDYILGCPLRRERVVAEQVLARAGCYRTVADNLEVEEVCIAERRYVVCRNPIAAREDAAEREARLDGKFVLTTSTELPAAEVAQAYKSLWRVERAFRTLESTLDVRPIFHQPEQQRRLRLRRSRRQQAPEGGRQRHACRSMGPHHRLLPGAPPREPAPGPAQPDPGVDLQRRLDAKGLAVPWPDLIRDLARVHSVLLDVDGTRYRLRTDLEGHAAEAFQATGVAVPQAVTAQGPAPAPPPAEAAATAPACSDKELVHSLTG
jgi:hypothetical protein